jgi:predicted MFS family arabinose efflux permease
MPFDGAIRVRRLRVLAGAYAVSSYGTYLNLVALNLFAYQWLGSALDLGLLMVVRLAAATACGPVASWSTGRWSRQRVLMWSNVGPAVALVLLVCSPSTVRTAALVVVAVLGGGANTVFTVALRSAVPDLVGQDRRGWANSLLVSGRSLAMVAGFASAAPVVSMWGYSAAFLVDAATFVGCAVTVALLSFPARVGPSARPATVGARGRGKLLLGGTMLSMIGLRAVDAFGSSSHNAALPIYSALVDPAAPAAFVGRFWTCWAVGNIVVQQAVRLSARRRGTGVGMFGFVVGTVLMSSAFVLGFAGLPLPATVLVAFVAGCADGLTEVSYVNHLQTLPDGARDRVFGLSATAENLGFGLGTVVNAVLLDRFSPLSVVAGSHGLAASIGLAFLVRLVASRAGPSRTRAGRGRHRAGRQQAGPDRCGPDRCGPDRCGPDRSEEERTIEHVVPTHRDHRNSAAVPGG